MSAVDEIRTERERQVSLGYDAEHDDGGGLNALVRYAENYILRARVGERVHGRSPGAARRDLIKAAALLSAAVDFLDRVPQRHVGPPEDSRG